jgi:NAD(P)-dependent dehydrogenase (short-subunit alcohol dehydrogenase family)
VSRYDVAGKTVLITGGGRGIGFGLANALGARGAQLALLDIEADSANAAAERIGAERAIGLAGDVRDTAAVEAAVAEATERFGGVDVVVANAGIAPAPAPVRAMPPEEFERVIEVNLLGVYRTVYAGLEQVIARQGQAVVVSSVYAFMNGMLLCPYAVAKAGVEQLGRALRAELTPYGASATVAYFGFVDTRMVQEGLEQRQALLGDEGELLPPFMRKMITPDQAGEALARAIERRQPRVIAPRYWAVASTLRGVLNPAMDHMSTRATKIQEMLRDADAAARREADRTPPSGSAGTS